MKTKQKIQFLIQKEWNKPCNNASDAHFRAERLTQLQKQLEKL